MVLTFTCLLWPYYFGFDKDTTISVTFNDGIKEETFPELTLAAGNWFGLVHLATEDRFLDGVCIKKKGERLFHAVRIA